MPENKPILSEAAAGSDIVKKYFTPQIMKVIGQEGQTETEILILPDGKEGLKAQSVKEFTDKYKTAPDFRTGTAQMLTLESFIAHTNRFKDKDSIVFANNDRSTPSLNAVIDYHKKTYEGAPRSTNHRIDYAFPMSDEWKAWAEKDGVTMDMQEFAEFLEDRIGDVEAPPAADDGEPDTDDPQEIQLKKLLDRIGGSLAGPQKLMELSKGLKINVDEKVHQALNLSSGETQLQFAHEHKNDEGAPIKVPNMFLIVIPVFNSGDLFRIPVRLRYRIRGGSITWIYKLYRTDQTFDTAFEDAINQVRKETELPVHIGKVES